MNDYDIKLDREKLVALLSKKEGLGELVEQVLNQVLESQMSEHLGAEKYEHNKEREGYRNGYRSRQLYTRIGSLTLRVPQTRDGSFSTDIFKRYQRHEQASVLGLMEMYLQGGLHAQSHQNNRGTLRRFIFKINSQSVVC